MMVVKKTETEKELTEALKNNQILKQENELLKQKIQKLDNERLGDAKVFEFQTKEIIRLKELHGTLKQNVQKHIDEMNQCEKTLIFEINETARLKKLLETNQANRSDIISKYEKRIKEQKDIVDMLRTNLSDANNHIVKLGEQRHEKNHELQRYKEFSATLENDVKMMSKAIVKIMMGVE